MTYSHGSKKTGGNRSNSYEIKDPCFIFTEIANTPYFWKKRKQELIANLENFGPFQWFWTLSCADLRWEENFAYLMHEMDMKITYDANTETEELVSMVHVGEESVSLEDFLKDQRFFNETRHALIRIHVLPATRNFDNRAKAFLKHVIMAKDNPMNTALFNYRIEIQARGAAHIHGVL